MEAGMYMEVKKAVDVIYTTHGQESPKIKLYDDGRVEIMPRNNVEIAPLPTNLADSDECCWGDFVLD